MDFETVEKLLKEYFDSAELEFTAEKDDDTLDLSLGVETDAYEDPINISVVVSRNGSLLFYARFDEFSASDLDAAYSLINTLNNEQPIFKAFVNDENRLELQHVVFEVRDEQHLVHLVDRLLTSLVSEPYIGLLRPLTELTK